MYVCKVYVRINMQVCIRIRVCIMFRVAFMLYRLNYCVFNTIYAFVWLCLEHGSRATCHAVRHDI